MQALAEARLAERRRSLPVSRSVVVFGHSLSRLEASAVGCSCSIVLLHDVVWKETEPL